MSFDANIPQPPDHLDNSQGDLLTNFGELNTQFGVNHGAFNDGTLPGKHKFVTLVERANTANDPPNPESNEVILFSAESSLFTTELYVKQKDVSNTNSQTYQLTKTGIPFIGMKPQAAANFGRGAGAFPRTIVPDSTFNVVNPIDSSVAGRFTLTYTNAIVNASGAATNEYYWSIQGFDDSNNPVIGTPRVTATYSDAISSARIVVDFRNGAGTLITTLTRANVIIWSVQ